MKPGHLRQWTAVLVVLITLAWGGYAGFHARHWFGAAEDPEAASPGVSVSTLINTYPFESVLGPVARLATTGAAVGQAVEFDLPADAGTRRALVLVEWDAASADAENLEVRLAWRTGESWSEPAAATGPSPLLLEALLDEEPREFRLTVLPSDGVVLEQPVSGWLALHRDRPGLD